MTLLGVINDSEGTVEVVVDRDLFAYPAMQCHPNTNTSTLVISMDDVMRFLSLTGHGPKVFVVPAHLS